MGVNRANLGYVTRATEQTKGIRQWFKFKAKILRLRKCEAGSQEGQANSTAVAESVGGLCALTVP